MFRHDDGYDEPFDTFVRWLTPLALLVIFLVIMFLVVGQDVDKMLNSLLHFT